MSALREAAQEFIADYDCGGSGHFQYYAERFRSLLAQQEDIAQNLQSRLDAAMLLEERRQEIAQPRRETEQEPSVRIKCTVVDNQHPSGVPFEQWVNAPRREWRELTEEERDTAIRWAVDQEDTHFSRTVARAIEAKLKEKNT